MTKLLLLLIGFLLLTGCIGPPPAGMTWDGYYSARDRLRQTYDKAEVTECKKLGSVSASAYEDVGEAKGGAIDKAVRMGADTLYLSEINARPNWHNYVVTRQGNVFDVYGTAYKCK